MHPDDKAYDEDPGRWGHSLANNRELLLGVLEAAGAQTVLEVGAYAGDVTRVLLEAGLHVTAIDPDPQPRLTALEADERVTLDRRTSLDALPDVPLGDAVIIDGDHNWFTVHEELRLIGERAGADLPLLLFHDVCWPHARRDDYFDPEAVPAEHRQPDVVAPATIFPGDPGIHPHGLSFRHASAHEGGPRNGVLTAIEDFAAARDDVRLAILPAFFGLGVLWRRDAPYAGALEALVAPYDRHPVLERLEANRVLHLSSAHVWHTRANLALEAEHRKADFLRKLLESKAFDVAIRISRLRQGGTPAFTKDEVRALVAEGPDTTAWR